MFVVRVTSNGMTHIGQQNKRLPKTMPESICSPRRSEDQTCDALGESKVGNGKSKGNEGVTGKSPLKNAVLKGFRSEIPWKCRFDWEKYGKSSKYFRWVVRCHLQDLAGLIGSSPKS